MEPKTAAGILGAYVKIAVAFVVISAVACVVGALLNPAQAILLIIPFFLAFLAASAYFLLRYVIVGSMSKKENAAFLIYELESALSSVKPPEPAPGEKVLFPRRACYAYLEKTGRGGGDSAKAVTVTDKRIIIGNPGTPAATYGDLTFWQPSMDKGLEAQGPASPDMRVGPLSAGSDSLGDFFEIGVTYLYLINTPARLRVYHPEAKSICLAFSGKSGEPAAKAGPDKKKR